MLAKQILTNPPKTFESRFPDPDHPQVPTFYCNLRIPKCSDAWPIMTAPQGKRPLETEGKDMHSQDLVPSTVVEQWRVNWDDTFDISIEGYWVCSNWDPAAVLYLHWRSRMHLGLTTEWNDRALQSFASWAIRMWLNMWEKRNHLYILYYTSLSTCESCSNRFCLNCQIPTEIRNRPGNSRRSFQVAQARLAGLHESAITLARHSSGSDWSCTKGPGCLAANKYQRWFRSPVSCTKPFYQKRCTSIIEGMFWGLGEVGWGR